MTNTFIIVSDTFGEKNRVNIEHICNYYSSNGFTHIMMSNGNLIVTPTLEREIDQALFESYCMIKELPNHDFGNDEPTSS